MTAMGRKRTLAAAYDFPESIGEFRTVTQDRKDADHDHRTVNDFRNRRSIGRDVIFHDFAPVGRHPKEAASCFERPQ